MRQDARLKTSILSLDEMLARLCLTVATEHGSLLTFLFHGLYLNRDEIDAGVTDAQQGITVEMFRRFVVHFREQSYRFVSPGDILKGLDPGEKNLLITFDDGYYNNIRALPVLEEFQAPAVFFVSTDNVKSQKAFWWDVVFREFRKRHRTEEELHTTIISYKRQRTAIVESDLRQQFGGTALDPTGDLDRPFSLSELKRFADHPLVSLGNHTKDHAILTNYSPAEIKEQIQVCQQDLHEITGKIPDMIAYPNGNESPAIRIAAWDVGLRLGVGTWPGKNRLPLQIDQRGAMTMKRFTLWGDSGIDPQCRVSRSGVSLYRSFRSVRLRIKNGFSTVLRSA